MCTKMLSWSHYERWAAGREFFGDFDLVFGEARIRVKLFLRLRGHYLQAAQGQRYISKLGSMTANTVFTCVTEPTNQLLEQSARLLMSLRWFGGSLAQARFVLGCTGPIPKQALELFDDYQAEMTNVERYDPTHGHSNKIALLGSSAN